MIYGIMAHGPHSSTTNPNQARNQQINTAHAQCMLTSLLVPALCVYECHCPPIHTTNDQGPSITPHDQRRADMMADIDDKENLSPVSARKNVMASMTLSPPKPSKKARSNSIGPEELEHARQKSPNRSRRRVSLMVSVFLLLNLTRSSLP